MKNAEVKRFEELYQRHQKLLKLKGKSEKAIDAYSRAIRRIGERFDCCPDTLSQEQLEDYFAELVGRYSCGIFGTSYSFSSEFNTISQELGPFAPLLISIVRQAGLLAEGKFYFFRQTGPGSP